MNHTVQIQREFVKEARKWDDLSKEEQKAYLQRHPKSKRRVTGGPKKRQRSLHNINALTDVGIHKRLRAALGMADQYRDVNRHINTELDGRKSLPTIGGGVTPEKMKKVIKKLFGDTDRISVEPVKRHPDNKVVGSKVFINPRKI